MIEIKQGDIVYIDAEPHAGHEMGGHDPQAKNIRRPFLVVSRSTYQKRSRLIVGLAMTHRHRNSAFRFPIVDIKSQINGDALLLQLLSYDFVARHGKVVGHLNNQRELEFILEQVQNIFAKDN